MKKNKLFYYWEKKDEYVLLLFLLRILSLIYLSGYFLRKTLYRLGLIRVKTLKTKVISVGNITSGGSGKTPFVLYLAKKLQEKRINFAILTRGYGRGKKATREIRKIESPDIKWEEVGDEPLLLSNHLPEIPVIIDKNRYISGKIAQDKYRADLVILDDGFQHWRLKRDLNILMIDSTFNLKEERILPAGRLREPLSSLKRAQVFILTRVDQSEHLDNIKMTLRSLNPQAPVVESVLKVTFAINWKDKTEIEPSYLSGKMGIAFCGIGNPYSFVNTLRGLGIEILNSFFFLDHYIYTRKDLFSLEEKCMELGADFLVTTEKDSIRLPENTGLKILILVIKVELKIISGEKELWQVLNL
ncbi:MAG: tetraacyldisaccharide 4'-kinase [candidate division Zixibacteria bacterium]|nr:tetraacyldisaccharide 4'-kinase [candidate division Zixibacteria bacterium]